jgi:hypothetical protein
MPAQTEWDKRRQRIDARGGRVDLDDDTSLGLFELKDWVGVATAAFFVLGLIFVPPVATPFFEHMYRDLGTQAQGAARGLVDFSQFLSDWHVHFLYGLVFATVPAASLVAGLIVPTLRLVVRRGLIAGAAVLGVLFLSTYVWIMYQPVSVLEPQAKLR